MIIFWSVILVNFRFWKKKKKNPLIRNFCAILSISPIHLVTLSFDQSYIVLICMELLVKVSSRGVEGNVDCKKTREPQEQKLDANREGCWCCSHFHPSMRIALDFWTSRGQWTRLWTLEYWLIRGLRHTPVKFCHSL